MKLRNKILTAVTILIVFTLILNPEMASLGLFIDAVGVDIFIILIQTQISVIFGGCVYEKFKIVAIYFNKIFMTLDPLFFIPTKENVVEYPPIILHAIPGLLSLYWLIFLVQ